MSSVSPPIPPLPTPPVPPTGIGLRARHHAELARRRPPVGWPAFSWCEIHAENYMGGGVPRLVLETVRGERPVSIHGVGLSLGSVDGIDPAHLERLADLVDRVEPMLVSEHLAWTGRPGLYLNDLMPVPYTAETLDVVAANVARVQDRLKRPILVENPSVYLAFTGAGMPEPDFLAALVRRTGCGLLCDVNNIHVSAVNVGGDPADYLARLPADAVGEIHLAGHAEKEVDGIRLLIDDHGSHVAEPVWDLFARAVARFPAAPALIEWDTAIPELPVLVAEAAEADRRRAAATTAATAAAIAAAIVAGRPEDPYVHAA